MCGIYGIWNRDARPVDPAALRRATTLLRHRGPDDEGYLLAQVGPGVARAAAGADTVRDVDVPALDEVRGAFDLAFGFRRLAILDPSPLGHQPMASQDGRRWIVFNGEVYNYRELREELRALGHRFRGGSDTEVILAAYEAWGEACLDRFNGMWAFAVWDVDARTLFLARDRLGVKPLFYAETGSRVAFASEAKALVGRHGIPFEPEPDALYQYLLTGGLPSSRRGETFFRGLRQVPPGCRLLITRDDVELRRYYRLPDHAVDDGRSPEALAEAYGELLTDAIRLRMRSDVPLGTCLSGGVDSSAIACTVSRLIQASGVDAAAVGARQKTFSAVYGAPGERYDESPYIRQIVSATSADPTYTVPTADRLHDDLERLIWHQDEPFGSTSIFAQWCVMAAARDRGVTVLLDGQGADEALGGYRPFDVLVADLLRRGRVVRALRTTGELAATSGAGRASLLSRALARQLPTRYLDMLRSRRDLSQAVAFRPEFARGRRPTPIDGGAARDLHAQYREQLLESSLPHLLRYEDRNSMAFSVEGRVPFLDYRLVEFSLRHAHRLTIHDGWTKWVLRRAMRDRVPPEILWRRDKVGFETPELDWARKLLAARPSTFSDGARLGEFLDLPALRTAVAAAGPTDGGPRRLWRWLNAELWLRTFAAADAPLASPPGAVAAR